MKTSHSPLVTVVTVSYNDRSRLEKTIKNVISQSYDRIEYIVIDGGSNDGSVDLLKKYDNQIALTISEPDRNVFDAMNKGIKQATGDWIIFMNSGDFFYENIMIEKVMALITKKIDFIYGDTQVNYKNGFRRVSKAKKINGMLWKELPFVHQSLFAKTELLNQHPFDLQYENCADFDFFLWAFHRGYRFCQLNQIISLIEAGGISDSNRISGAKEKRQIIKKYYHGSFIDLWFIVIITKTIIIGIIKRLSPPRLITKLIKLKYILIR